MRAEMGLANGASRGRVKFNVQGIVPSSRRADTLDEATAKEEALEYLVNCVRSILSSRFNMPRRTQITRFGVVQWEDGTNFRLS